MRHVGRREDDAAAAERLRRTADGELAAAVDDGVELVDAGVGVRGVLLPRLERVEAGHQLRAGEERRLAHLLRIPDGAGSDVGEEKVIRGAIHEQAPAGWLVGRKGGDRKLARMVSTSDPTTEAAQAEALAARLLELAAIRSVSRDEKALADHLEPRLRALPGVQVRRIADNLVATLPALSATSVGKPRVLLCGHLDTVPENQNLPPRREGDLIHGLGTSDLKAGLVVLLAVFEELARLLAADPGAAARVPFDPALVFYSKEEIAFALSGLNDLEAALPELKQAAFAICVEPTSNAVELGCLGTLHAEVTVRGKAAHAARPWLGENAIHAALPLLARISMRPERRWSPPGRPDVEYREVMSVTGVNGGKARNVIPDHCTFNINFRFAPDRSPDEARQIVIDLVAGFRNVEVVFKDLAPAGRIPAKNALCDRLVALAGQVRAKQAWTDVGRFTAWNVDAVSFGPGFPELAHQQAEHASIAKMVESRRIFRQLLGLESGSLAP